MGRCGGERTRGNILNAIRLYSIYNRVRKLAKLCSCFQAKIVQFIIRTQPTAWVCYLDRLKITTLG